MDEKIDSWSRLICKGYLSQFLDTNVRIPRSLFILIQLNWIYLLKVTKNTIVSIWNFNVWHLLNNGSKISLDHLVSVKRPFTSLDNCVRYFLSMILMCLLKFCSVMNFGIKQVQNVHPKVFFKEFFSPWWIMFCAELHWIFMHINQITYWRLKSIPGLPLWCGLWHRFEHSLIKKSDIFGWETYYHTLQAHCSILVNSVFNIFDVSITSCIYQPLQLRHSILFFGNHSKTCKFYHRQY